MAQEQLNISGYQLVLQEDQIKRELEDRINLTCANCLEEEDVNIYDSMKNTSPFFCSNCYNIESFEELKNTEDTFSNLFLILIQLIHYCQWQNSH